MQDRTQQPDRDDASDLGQTPQTGSARSARRSDATTFPDGGESGALLRGIDWASTPLGAVESWPIALKTSVRAMLATQQATCVFWGKDLVNLYNDGFIPILGEKHPRAMGQRARDCWSDAWPVVGELLNNVVSRSEAVLFNEMLVPVVRAGRLEDAWWNYSYSPLFDDIGAVAGVLVVATETTVQVAQRRQLESARIEADLARRELHALFMQAPFAMALFKGPEHRFTLVNEPYLALVGRDVVEKTVREVFSEVEVAYYLPFLDRAYEGGEPVLLTEAPLHLTDSSGSLQERFINVGYHPFRDAAGSVVGLLAVIHDVTSLVRARMREAELRKAAELASLAKDEFLATVSHELRTPLTAILGWARLLENSREPHKLDKGLAVIKRNAIAQATLIDDILDVSRIVAGKIVLALRRVRVAAIIDNAVESVRPAATAKQIHLQVTVDDPGIELVADEDRLQQIVWNLLSNAVKFTAADGQVRVTARQDGPRVSIRVEDTGRGISAQFLPHLFERFRQDDGSSTKRYGGLGLGLAIVRHLVELHGGTVQASSEGEGRGACFEVVLPISAVQPREAAEPRSSVHTSADAGVVTAESLEGIRVLLVDDEQDARELIAAVLAEAGAQVTQAGSVELALDTLRSSPQSYDVLVSDLGMPGEDGYGLMRRVRAEAGEAFERLPALALTAYASAEDRRRALAAGFQEHAAKPIDPDVLVGAVAALARR